uniref:Tetratricopeptide repeat domain 16 n=1 Tax=Jaculus jaculus TaxID=51337 RepID=A0A8C5NXA5_JACJA
EVRSCACLDLENTHSHKIKKPWVIPAPIGTLQRIFGTSQVFYNFEDMKPTVTLTTVPLRIKEYYQRGHQCLEREDWEMAVLFFSRALHLDPDRFYAFRAEAFIQLCDFSSAVQNLRRACNFQPDNVKYLERLAFVLYLQGQCLYDQCDFQEALNIFLQVSELQPQKACFRYRCMACLLALKQHQECLSLITREVRHGTATPDVYILRARIYNFFQKPKLCYQDLRSALLLDPKHLQAKRLLQIMVDQAQQARQDAGILAVQGKLQRALKRINCAIDNNPLDPSFFLFRGTLYRRLQEFDQAVEDLLKAMDMVLDSEDPLVSQAQRQLLLAYNDFAVHCYTHGAYQEGVQLLNKAIRDEQNEKGLYINRGDCFFQLGNLAFAEADYKQALALSPLDEGANMRMGVLQEKMGFCEQTRRQFQKAEDHFSVAIKHNPYKIQYYMHRAKSRQLLQDVFGARQDVATVLLLNPKQPEMLPLITSLFPNMSVEEILESQIAHLASLQLKQMGGRGQQASHPEGIVGSCHLGRKVAGLPQEPPGLQLSSCFLPQVKEKPTPHKAASTSGSYPDQTSSGSVLSCMSETETSIYKSTSTIAEIVSDSSLLKPEFSDSRNKEGLGLSKNLRQTEMAKDQKATALQGQSQGLGQSASRTKAARDQGKGQSSASSPQDQSPRPGQVKDVQNQNTGSSSNKTGAIGRLSPSHDKAKASRGESQKPEARHPPS